MSVGMSTKYESEEYYLILSKKSYYSDGDGWEIAIDRYSKTGLQAALSRDPDFLEDKKVIKGGAFVQLKVNTTVTFSETP